MADFSKSKVRCVLFQQEAQDIKKTDSGYETPHVTGFFEIAVEDLNEWFSLAMAIKPEDNYKKDGQIVKLRFAGWNNEAKSGRKYVSGYITPDRYTEFKEEEPVADTKVVTPSETPRDLSRAL